METLLPLPDEPAVKLRGTEEEEEEEEDDE